MVLGAILAAGFVYHVVPRIVGLGPTLRRLRSGRIGWLALRVGLEAFSMFGDIVMFRGVFAVRGTPIGWRRTADIRMAGAAATKLLAAAGTGGIALTVWTLRGWAVRRERRRLRRQGLACDARGLGLPHDLVRASGRPRGDRLLPSARSARRAEHERTRAD